MLCFQQQSVEVSSQTISSYPLTQQGIAFESNAIIHTNCCVLFRFNISSRSWDHRLYPVRLTEGPRTPAAFTRGTQAARLKGRPQTPPVSRQKPELPFKVHWPQNCWKAAQLRGNNHSYLYSCHFTNSETVVCLNPFLKQRMRRALPLKTPAWLASPQTTTSGDREVQEC